MTLDERPTRENAIRFFVQAVHSMVADPSLATVKEEVFMTAKVAFKVLGVEPEEVAQAIAYIIEHFNEIYTTREDPVEAKMRQQIDALFHHTHGNGGT